MISSAAWALVIAKLDQGQGRLFGAANMTAAFDICVGWRGTFFRLIGLTAQVDGGARRHRYSQDDHDQGFQNFWHAVILAVLDFFCKNILQWICLEVRIASVSFETNFLVAVGYSSQGR